MGKNKRQPKGRGTPYYRQLLRKYISLVHTVEGADFLDIAYAYGDQFTAEEMIDMVSLRDEALSGVL